MNLPRLIEILEAFPKVGQSPLGGVSSDDAPILVPGVAEYTYGTLKQNILRKLEDLAGRAKRDDFESIGDRQLEILFHFWRTISAHKTGKKAPDRTQIS